MRLALVPYREEFHLDKTTENPDHELIRDAGGFFPHPLRNAALKASTLVPAAGSSPSLEGHPLRDVVNDTRSRAFCGPTAVSAIAGAPVSLVRDAYRLVRYGPRWVEKPRAPSITGTTYYETEKVLRLLGFAASWQPVAGSPTFGAFLETRSGGVRTHPCAVFVTGHVVAVSGWQFCDTHTKGAVVEADDAPRRRARVKRVLLITGRVPPSDIPRKNYSAAIGRQKARAAYVRFLSGMGASHELDRSDPWDPTITVTFSDGKKIERISSTGDRHWETFRQPFGTRTTILKMAPSGTCPDPSWRAAMRPAPHRRPAITPYRTISWRTECPITSTATSL
jgi:hypothetical protein